MISPDFICLNSLSRGPRVKVGWGFGISDREVGTRFGEERSNLVHDMSEDDESLETATVDVIGGGAKEVEG